MCEFNPLFFRLLFELLKKKEVIAFESLQVTSSLELWKTLQQSFLGNESFYWLGNIVEQIKTKKKNGPDLVELLSLYKAPHSVAFFLPADYKLSVSAHKRMVVVDLGAALTLRDVEQLFAFFGCSLSSRKRSLIKELVHPARGSGARSSGILSLDEVCMLFYYLSVTHARLIDSLKKNLATIIAPELSLYSLATLFFTKQDKRFFSIWSERCNDYPLPFWVAYWSEQVWQAYHAITFLKQNNFPAARRFAYRLPSSFLKTDWRYCSLEKLKNSYAMLYDIDFAFKRGSTFCSLDLFFCDYFLGKPQVAHTYVASASVADTSVDLIHSKH